MAFGEMRHHAIGPHFPRCGLISINASDPNRRLVLS